ncbi:hypothetical protein [uncultured Proteiniphilum sp.]|uniref:hypothetical protein n=1 Tax=uncultured Proteiniphilum sp. TaxID=497637 RepID=UPI002611FA55|nr:hypothetical protein [uncultured Proteiniphilum sp.]
MKFMEHRGSGFGKVIDATKALPAYTDKFMAEFEANMRTSSTLSYPIWDCRQNPETNEKKIK